MSDGVDDTGRITRNPDTETAILAGGCFWGMEDLFRHQPGVVDTRVGYTGGENDHATYRNHPGHAEAIEIVFDPTQTTYRDILAYFFQVHDPTTLNSRATTTAPATAPRSSPPPCNRSRSPARRSPTSTHPVCGRGSLSPPSSPRALSGKPSPSIRIT